MNPYPLNACFLTASFHFMREKVLGSWEQSFVRVKHISGIDKVLQLLTQKIGNWNFPLAFLCLRRSGDILSVQTLIRFVDINLFCHKIDIGSGKSQ